MTFFACMPHMAGTVATQRNFEASTGSPKILPACSRTFFFMNFNIAANTSCIGTMIPFAARRCRGRRRDLVFSTSSTLRKSPQTRHVQIQMIKFSLNSPPLYCSIWASETGDRRQRSTSFSSARQPNFPVTNKCPNISPFHFTNRTNPFWTSRINKISFVPRDANHYRSRLRHCRTAILRLNCFCCSWAESQLHLSGNTKNTEFENLAGVQQTFAATISSTEQSRDTVNAYPEPATIIINNEKI